MNSFDKKLSIKSWAEEDRPREKLLHKGRHALTEAELIAILLGSGNRNETAVELAKRILASCNNDLSQLAQLSIKDLMKFNGIGEAKAISIVAALEIGRRKKETANKQSEKIGTSNDAYELIKSRFEDLPHEEFWIILLNKSNTKISTIPISKGGVAGTVVDIRIILKIAIENLASGIILCHNHPSGNLKPSEQDLKLTRKLKESALLMDILILDHLIITNTQYLSFADEGLL